MERSLLALLLLGLMLFSYALFFLLAIVYLRVTNTEAVFSSSAIDEEGNPLPEGVSRGRWEIIVRRTPRRRLLLP
jgi:hypothetical protein